MYDLITSIFNNFTVDGVLVPVEFLIYKGHANTYIVWTEESMDRSLSGDDKLSNYVDYYDFTVYSKNNYLNVIEKMKKKLNENNFMWQVNRSSGDMYDPDTGYYQKTLNFSYLRSE